MKEATTFVGLDAHKKTIHVALLAPGSRVAVEWELQNEPAAVRRLGKKLLREGASRVQACYEAGPCGYAQQRQLQEAGVDCQVIAPSLPTKNCHAALSRAIGITCGYQSDSSSKRPGSSALSASTGNGIEEKRDKVCLMC